MARSNETDALIAKINEYKNRASVTRRSHYLASTSFSHKNLWLGTPIVVITAVVGTSIFGTLQDNPNVYIKIAVGILSISAAVLAALQTYLGFSEKSARHKEAGAKYAAIWRALDVLGIELQNKGDSFSVSAIDKLREIIAKLDEAGEKSLSVRDSDYQLAVKELREKISN